MIDNFVNLQLKQLVRYAMDPYHHALNLSNVSS